MDYTVIYFVHGLSLHIFFNQLIKPAFPFYFRGRDGGSCVNGFPGSCINCTFDKSNVQLSIVTNAKNRFKPCLYHGFNQMKKVHIAPFLHKKSSL